MNVLMVFSAMEPITGKLRKAGYEASFERPD